MASENLNETSLARLEILLKNDDGFEIARKDLELRGQGELTGLRQAGRGELELSEIMREPELLQRAKGAAERLIAADPELSEPRHSPLKELVTSILSGPFD